MQDPELSSRNGTGPRASMVSKKVRPALDLSREADRPPGAEESRVKVILHPRQFSERFRVAASLTPRYSSTPLLETVRLEADEGGNARLHARSFEAEVSLAVPVLKVISPGAAQLPAEEFGRFLKQTPAASLTVERPTQKKPPSAGPGTRSEVVLARDTRESRTFATFDPAEFPTKPPGEVKGPVTLRAWRLSRLIRRTLFSTDPAATRYALGGCHVSHVEGCLHLVATDGQRLVDAFEAVPFPTPPPMRARRRAKPVGSHVVSANALRTLAQVLDLFQNASATVGFTGKGLFRVTSGEFSFTANPLKGRFPEWESILPQAAIATAEVLDSSALHRLCGAKAGLRAGGDPLELRLQRRRLTVKELGQGGEVMIFVRPSLLITDEEVVAVVRRADLADYLAEVKAPFSLAFPSEEGQPLAFQTEGFRYFVTPTDRDGAPPKGLAATTDDESPEPDEEPPSEEAQGIRVPSLENGDDGTRAGQATAGRAG